MSGIHSFTELLDRFSPQEQEEIAAQTAVLREEMTLQELREALKIPQEELGARLGIKQPAVSRLESRKGLQLKHLERVVQAMGGELVVTARFPMADVRLNDVMLGR
jgi:hypothetical protein